MKFLIYISGILGGTFLILGVLAPFEEQFRNNLLLISGLVLLLLIYAPLYISDRVRERRKINKIINSYKGKNKDQSKVNMTRGHTTSGGIDEYPFHSQKSGLTWGGGNIHGANAFRGIKKKFLKR